MKKLMALLSIAALPMGMSYAFVPYVSSVDSLRLYPWPQSITLSPPACTLNVLQDTIWIVIGSNDPITKEAALVCSLEITKNFYFAIDTVRGPIKRIRIEQRNSLPNDTVVIAFGKKNDPLITSISGINGLIPNKAEGYVLKETVQNKKLIIVGAGYDHNGTFHSASTLRELTAQHCRGLVPTTMVIQDWPDCEWREVSWSGLEVGVDTLLYPDLYKDRLAQLDYFSLLKCGQVEHSNHRFYFKMPDPFKTPDEPDTDKIELMRQYYNDDVTSNNLPNFWYPKYRYQGIEPIPYYMNFAVDMYKVWLNLS